MNDQQAAELAGRRGARLVHHWPIRCVDEGRPLAVSWCGTLLGLAGAGGTLHVIAADEPDAPPQVATFGFQPLCPAWTIDGWLLCGASFGVAAMLISWKPGRRPSTRNLHRELAAPSQPDARPGVTAVVTGPDPRWAALISERLVPPAERVGLLEGADVPIEGTIWLWDLPGGGSLWSEAIPDRITEAAFTPDGKLLRYRHGLRVETRHALTGRWASRAPLRLDAPGVAFDAQAARVLATWRPDERPGARDGLAVVDLADGAIVHPLRPGNGDGPRLRPRDLSRDGTLALALRARPGDAGEVVTAVVVWDVPSGEVLDELPLEPLRPVDARFLPDGGFVVATLEGGLLRFAPAPRTGLAPALTDDGPGPGDAPALGG